MSKEFHKVYGSDIENLSEVIKKLSSEVILFGHQSVGSNILSGISYWENSSGESINRVTSRETEGAEDAVFLDFKVGSNGSPVSKIDDFVSVVERIPEDLRCTAFFKFCYVDFNADSDIDQVFSYYEERMHYLKDLKPNTRIVLVTVPLTTIQGGWKALVKRILGRKPGGTIENIHRNEFNDKVIKGLSSDFQIFDLARVESTLPDGRRSTYSYNGEDHYCLATEYTYDGGHLNDKGSQIVAYNLLTFLGSLDQE